MPVVIADVFSELTYKTSRSGGKGGQNVNKVATKVELAWNVRSSDKLSLEEKELLEAKWENRLTKEGVLLIVSQSERTQLGNKRVVHQKLAQLLILAFKKDRIRKATKVPRAAKERRLEVKKRVAEIKKNRGNRFEL